ncbi:MAG: transketolase, partial [Planctomycetota bacterium]
LGVEDRLDELLEKRKALKLEIHPHKDYTKRDFPAIHTGTPHIYEAETLTDCRSAYGKVLEDLAKANNQSDIPKVLAFTCDLEGSVKMNLFHQVSPHAFFESGIQEHHTATLTGRLSKEGFLVFFSTFGVFAGSEVYNQQRLNDYNRTNLKVVATHCGIDVGEDGPTHQCIDFIGLIANLSTFQIFFPADPNQTDHLIRFIAQKEGNDFVAMGRSKLPIITKEDGTPFFDQNYIFVPGKGDILRNGKDGTIFSFGPALHNVLEALPLLQEKGISPTVINMASLKPIDKELILQAAQKGPIMTVEDHRVDTGLGSLVAKILAENRLNPPFQSLGVKAYGSSGKPKEVYQLLGLDSQGIQRSFMEFYSS